MPRFRLSIAGTGLHAPTDLLARALHESGAFEDVSIDGATVKAVLVADNAQSAEGTLSGAISETSTSVQSHFASATGQLRLRIEPLDG